METKLEALKNHGDFFSVKVVGDSYQAKLLPKGLEITKLSEIEDKFDVEFIHFINNLVVFRDKRGQ